MIKSRRISAMACERRWVFNTLAILIALAILLPAAAMAADPAGAKTKNLDRPRSKLDCSFKVEKDKTGKRQYRLTGKDCKDFVAKMKPVQKGKAYGGTYCEGDCHCTWYDRCMCLICRGCCSELFTFLPHR